MIRDMLLSLCFLLPLASEIGTQYLLRADSGVVWEAPGDTSPNAASCKEMLDRAISLNDGSRRAVSAGGQRALGLEVEKYLHAVLIKKISGCVSLAAAQKDAVLSRRILDLAYSYSDAADQKICAEAARLYSDHPEMTKAILMDFESNKRQILTALLRSGLAVLYFEKSGETAHVKMLQGLLDELESK